MKEETVAEWTLNPITERELAGVRRRQTVCRVIGWALGITTFGLFPLTLALLSLNASYQWTGLLFLTAIVLLSVEAFRRSAKIERGVRAAFLALREASTAIDGTAVDLTILQGETPTGRARGVLWFEEGRMYFVGDRTSFGLVPSQVEGSLTPWISKSSTLPLKIRTVAGRVALAIEPLADASRLENPRQVQATLNDAIFRWLRDDVPGEGQLPPLALGPDVASTTALLWGALLTGAFWTTMLVLAIGAARTSPYLVFAFVPFGAILGLTIPGLYAPRRRWRSLRDRRRLERSQWKR